MTGKIFNLWFADAGLLNKSCADRVMAACGVFLVWLFFFFPSLGWNKFFLKTALNVFAFSKCRIILSGVWKHAKSHSTSTPTTQGRLERLLEFDFCRVYITKTSSPFLWLFMLGTLTYFPDVLKGSLQKLGSGTKSKQLLLSCRGARAAPAAKWCPQICCWHCALQGVGLGLLLSNTEILFYSSMNRAHSPSQCCGLQSTDGCDLAMAWWGPSS